MMASRAGCRNFVVIHAHQSTHSGGDWQGKFSKPAIFLCWRPAIAPKFIYVVLIFSLFITPISFGDLYGHAARIYPRGKSNYR